MHIADLLFVTKINHRSICVTYLICVQFILDALYLGRNECKNAHKIMDSYGEGAERPLQGNFPVLPLKILNYLDFHNEYRSFSSFFFFFLFFKQQ